MFQKNIENCLSLILSIPLDVNVGLNIPRRINNRESISGHLLVLEKKQDWLRPFSTTAQSDLI
jgi:hypothetical protein